MDPTHAIRLRCLELAVERARTESAEKFLERVAELQTWFYDRIVAGAPKVASPEPQRDPQQSNRQDKRLIR